MKLRFITPTLHGVADYSAGLGLMIAPFLLNLGASSHLAIWISVLSGVAVFAASLLTDYRFSLLRVIPFQGHLAIDLVVAVSFMIIPFALGFTGLDAAYYWFNATVVFVVVSLSASK
ncbi:SPW repeat domain-containing protein [Flagellimonas sp.]|uniref:SPW repeat domain-containing protein n=1 Tax=Flagellimonas sp. TaxID=2058762 RepID=UPI003BAECD5B